VLVVEDEQAIADVISLYLRRDGYTVRVAADGEHRGAELGEHGRGDAIGGTVGSVHDDA